MEWQKATFREQLDTVLMISKPARENLGEDSFYCAADADSAIVAVCDGCGGLGARKYESFKGHTGAYIASRTVSGAVCDWYHIWRKENGKSKQTFAESLDTMIRRAYKICEPYGIEKMRIMGSMVRKFPTTLALAYAEKDENGILIRILWAGDSRVYLLDKNGLAQLTRDDTDVEDALENLISDGAMTNVLSSDGKYTLNYRTIYITDPCLIFAATDGCFGYIPSPMEFEYTILNAIAESRTPDEFKRMLYDEFTQYAEDDFAFGMMSFLFGSYRQTGKVLSGRLQYMKEKYICPLEQNGDDENTRELWESYKPEYERYLRDDVKKKL